ncbi:MAG: anti-sigma factor family protein [Pararhodobacter sp.]
MIRLGDNQPVTDETLNAYVDGALTSEDAARIAQCAASDPRIARRIALLYQLKAGVAGLADDVVMIDLPMQDTPAPRRRYLPVALGALAATVLLALSLLWFVQAGDRPVEAATDSAPVVGDTTLARFITRHDAWIASAEQTVSPDSVGFGLEELMGATGLRLVHHALSSAADTDPGQQFAFVGPNGCRLSLFEVASPSGWSAPLNLTISDGLLTARWLLDGQGYALIARTMDPARFATISAVVHDALRDRGSVDAQALASLQRARQPCLG